MSNNYQAAPNEPAFPNNSQAYHGLTIRQHFAALAMQGLCVGKVTKNIMQGQCIDIAAEAVEIADALINALNK